MARAPAKPGTGVRAAAWARGSPLRRIAPCAVYALDLEPTETCPSLLHWVLDDPWQDVGFWTRNPDAERAELSAKELCSALRALGLRRWPRFLLRSPLARLLCHQPGHLVAVCFGVSTDPRVHPRTDYHMFRLDRNGWWSHKPRYREPQDVDSGERRISDPRKADRGE